MLYSKMTILKLVKVGEICEVQGTPRNLGLDVPPGTRNPNHFSDQTNLRVFSH